MSVINFDCPKCGQNLDAPANLAGLFVECPACGSVIKVPTPKDRTTQAVETAQAAPPQFTAPPPRPEDKSSTMRIDLPPDVRLPPPAPRRITIKRSGRK